MTSNNPGGLLRQRKPQLRPPSVGAREKLRRKAVAKMKRARGAPSVYTPEIAAAICHDIAVGHTVAQAGQNAGITAKTIFAWRLQHDDFRNAYERARERKWSITPTR